MTDEFYIIALVALLPITATLLVFQTNPYQALVIRGILGAVASLAYALLGAADVALTEALVGTMLSITLYAVAVRSSMSLRLGVLDGDEPLVPDPYEPLLTRLRKILIPHHMRLERITYLSPQALQTALIAKDVHAICVAPDSDLFASPGHPPLQLKTRVHRLYDLIQASLTDQQSLGVELTYVNPAQLEQTDAPGPSIVIPESVEVGG